MNKVKYGPSIQLALFHFLFCIRRKDKLYETKMQIFSGEEQTEQVIFK